MNEVALRHWQKQDAEELAAVAGSIGAIEKRILPGSYSPQSRI
ncbi:MAG: hypothetical protein V4450_04260 [Bacteroidota bacterium]